MVVARDRGFRAFLFARIVFVDLPFWIAVTEIARNLGLGAAGIIGVHLAWKRVTVANRQAEAQLRQAELARRDHVAELFNRAIGQLKDERLEVRLGAIFTMRQICMDFPDLAEPVIRVLTIYLKEITVNYEDARQPVDIREIMRLLREQTGG